MARRVFFSFHYQPDSWRASQVRNMGMVEGNRPVTDNRWETIKRGGDAAIKRWIDDQLSGKSCLVVLIGNATVNRKWINYEISKAWNDGKGVVGIYIHKLGNQYRQQSTKGHNPFQYVKSDGLYLSKSVKDHDPPYSSSKDVDSFTQCNIADWVEEAIAIRTVYSDIYGT